MRQLVTGGAGFIGSHLVRELVRRDMNVRVFDDLSTGTKSRLADVWNDIEWIDGDVRDAEAVRRACRGVEVVQHLAAIASVPRSIAEPVYTHAVNVDGTLNVLLAAQEAGVRRIVFASSSACYGDNPTSPKSEDLPARPLSPYGVQKLAAEAYIPVWNALYGVEAVALRYFNVFGPAQDPNGAYAAVIPAFITAALDGRPPVIYGDGEQSRDFIYVGDVADINILAATVPAVAGKVLNVGTGCATTLNEILRHVGAALGRGLTPEYQDARPGDIRESLADITLLRTILGYEPRIPFAEGVARTVRAYAESRIAVTGERL